MVRGESLFERLRRAREPRSQTLGDDRGVLIRSINGNLQRILGAREGHAPAQMDYGIPAPSEVANLCGGGLETMQRIVKTAVEKYEPRLTDVTVLHVETEADQMELVFSIRGRPRDLPDGPMVSFDTFVDSTGQLTLE